MSEYQTLYRRDYKWPELPAHFPRSEPGCFLAGPRGEPAEGAATCVNRVQGSAPTPARQPPPPPKLDCEPRKPPPPPDHDDEEAKPKCGNRATPTQQPGETERGRPKLGACPTTVELKYSETDACLKTLLENNPNLLNVMHKKPCFDPIKKFNCDRLRSTYQVDFDHVEDSSFKDWASIPRKKQPCPLDEPDPEKVECRPHLQSRKALIRCRGGEHSAMKGPCGPKSSERQRHRKAVLEREKPSFTVKRSTRWSSEYRDVYDDTGIEIMREMRMSKRQKEILDRRKKIELMLKGEKGN